MTEKNDPPRDWREQTTVSEAEAAAILGIKANSIRNRRLDGNIKPIFPCAPFRYSVAYLRGILGETVEAVARVLEGEK